MKTIRELWKKQSSVEFLGVHRGREEPTVPIPIALDRFPGIGPIMQRVGSLDLVAGVGLQKELHLHGGTNSKRRVCFPLLVEIELDIARGWVDAAGGRDRDL